MTKLFGSCLCGGVRYQINGALTGALNCHCTMCRKAHGAAFRSRARVEASDFEFIAGEDMVKFYEIACWQEVYKWESGAWLITQHHSSMLPEH